MEKFVYKEDFDVNKIIKIAEEYYPKFYDEFILSFNNKEEQVKLHYNNQCYISSDKIEESSLLYRYYNSQGFGLKVIILE